VLVSMTCHTLLRLFNNGKMTRLLGQHQIGPMIATTTLSPPPTAACSTWRGEGRKVRARLVLIIIDEAKRSCIECHASNKIILVSDDVFIIFLFLSPDFSFSIPSPSHPFPFPRFLASVSHLFCRSWCYSPACPPKTSKLPQPARRQSKQEVIIHHC
jgi:hypothetical protein